MIEILPTPCVRIDGPAVRRNLQRMADYARSHGLALRPHTKTHKSLRLARMQLELGAVGLTAAKAGEAAVMAEVADDVLVAYPAVDLARCGKLAELALKRTVRVAADSGYGINNLKVAAEAAGSTIGVMIDLDVGHGRTGAQTPADALQLAQHVARSKGLRLDGIMFFPGHIPGPDDSRQAAMLKAVDDRLAETLDLWVRSGLEARIVSGGSTPTAYQSHQITRMNEIRPGTYVYNDLNSVYGGFASMNDCAARVLATVVSTAVPGQVVIDAGSKALTSDRCGPAPDSGHGYIVEYPQAKIFRLFEEHGLVDVRGCERAPAVGQQVTLIPNHVCPCINLQDTVWWQEPGHTVERVRVDARGEVF